MGKAARVEGLDKFLNKVDTFAKRAPKVNEAIVNEVAFAAKQILLAEARSDAPNNLRNWARGRGARFGITYTIRSRKSEGTTQAILRPGPPGPWYFLEYGSRGKTYKIPRSPYSRGRRKALSNRNDFVTRGQIIAGPQPMRHTWTAGHRKAVAAGRGLYNRAARHMYLNMFKG